MSAVPQPKLLYAVFTEDGYDQTLGDAASAAKEALELTRDYNVTAYVGWSESEADFDLAHDAIIGGSDIDAVMRGMGWL